VVGFFAGANGREGIEAIWSDWGSYSFLRGSFVLELSPAYLITGKGIPEI